MEEKTRVSRKTENKKRYAYAAAIDWTLCILVVALCIAFVFMFLLGGMRIENDAMGPALQPGDTVVIDRIWHHLARLDRGRIIAYRAGDGSLRVGRVIALSGEEVQTVGGETYIDGMYLNEEEYLGAARGDMAPETIPHGSVAVMTDDGAGSALMVPYARIIGSVRFIVSPLSRFAMFV